MRPRKRLALQVEPLERKALLSASTVPVLTQLAYTEVLISLRHYGIGLQQDQSLSNLKSELAIAAARVPFGTKDLLPIWQNDVDGFQHHVPGSAGAMLAKIKADFFAFVEAGVASGAFTTTGNVAHQVRGQNPTGTE
jgi:hypothetical protein